MDKGDNDSDVDGLEDDADGEGRATGDETAATPSEAFLSLQKELEAKENIQRENEEREKNREKLAAEAVQAALEKVRLLRSAPQKR